MTDDRLSDAQISQLTGQGPCYIHYHPETATTSTPIPTPTGGITLMTAQTQDVAGNRITGIPTGVKQFTITFDSWEVTFGSEIRFRLGTSAGLYAGLYGGVVGFLTTLNTIATGALTNFGRFIATGGTAGGFWNGSVTFTLQDAATNVWVWSGTLSAPNTFQCSCSGSTTLPGVITQLDVYHDVGSASIGTINVAYQ